MGAAHDRSAETQEGLRPHRRGRRDRLPGQAGARDRVPRAERRRQVDDDADDPRSRPADLGMLAPSVTRRLIERMAEDSTQSPDDADEIRNLLSAREVDVLLLVARGLSNAEIGAKLNVAETTVKSHVQSMLAKLASADRK